jgi:hypothetical protein
MVRLETRHRRLADPVAPELTARPLSRSRLVSGFRSSWGQAAAVPRLRSRAKTSWLEPGVTQLPQLAALSDHLLPARLVVRLLLTV